MKIFIVTEAGRKIGFGHFTRCRAIADAFERRGIRPHFIINGDAGVRRFVGGKSSSIFNWLKKQSKLLKIIANADVVIIDSYLAKALLYKQISRLVKLVVYLDDNNRISYPPGVIINAAICAHKLKYPRTIGRTYLLGAKFVALRKAFWSVAPIHPNRQIRAIMIAFGGSDPRNMTPRVLRALTKEFPCLTKEVVVGQGVINLDEIKKNADRKAKLIYCSGDSKMIKAMRSCDIAVSAGGQTLYELARLGVPALTFVVAQNQMNNVLAWQDAGFTDTIGCWKDQDITLKLAKGIRHLEKENLRKKRGAIGRRLIDGRGAMRISGFIMDYLKKRDTQSAGIDLKEADIRDCRDIWLWRNNVTARQASFSGKPIAYAQHKSWFRSKLTDPRTSIYIAKKNSEKIGAIRFERKEGRAYASVNLNPIFYGRGLGGIIIKSGSQKFLSHAKTSVKVVAEIKRDNIISQKAFARAGYQYVRGDADRVIYAMER